VRLLGSRWSRSSTTSNVRLPRASNVLTSNDLRQGIKDYSSWPTIPQLYVKGEFVGGCDIIREMFQAGELQALLTEKGVAARAS